jgi:hypothetical protein
MYIQALIRSYGASDWFVIGVAINILLLRSLRAFGCGSAALCLCASLGASVVKNV